jgi:hypothetical protein
VLALRMLITSILHTLKSLFWALILPLGNEGGWAAAHLKWCKGNLCCLVYICWLWLLDLVVKAPVYKQLLSLRTICFDIPPNRPHMLYNWSIELYKYAIALSPSRRLTFTDTSRLDSNIRAMVDACWFVQLAIVKRLTWDLWVNFQRPEFPRVTFFS